jgi:hypothetical protein
MQFHKRLIFAWMLNLLLPGLGHFYWREYAFGLFVFLVMLLASVLYVASFFVPMPGAVTWLVLGLPIMFYGFTFVDLARTARLKRVSINRTTRAAGGSGPDSASETCLDQSYYPGGGGHRCRRFVIPGSIAVRCAQFRMAQPT